MINVRLPESFNISSNVLSDLFFNHDGLNCYKSLLGAGEPYTDEELFEAVRTDASSFCSMICTSIEELPDALARDFISRI
jgi:hypothetical protein